MAAKFITCGNLKNIKHGFFMNNAGYSTGIYKSLNCGIGSNDNPENVMKNRTLAMNALGFKDAHNLYSLYQIHSNKAIILTSVPEIRHEADGMVTNTPGLALGILTADCSPILFFDKKANVIGTSHAGWKGAIGGIIENTIVAMERLGAKRQDIAAAIGPTISQDSYEVGAEFYETFLAAEKTNAMFFCKSIKNGHFMFNLPFYVAKQLKDSGIVSIEDCALDTYSDPENFFSYRRNCLAGINGYGRNLSVIVL